MIVQFQLFSAVVAGPQGPLVNNFFFLWFRLKSALSVIPGPKVPLFCLKSVPWTSNELADNDVEKCEKSSLTPTKSPTSLLLLLKLWVRFSPKKENPVHQTKISTKTDKDSFSLKVYGVLPYGVQFSSRHWIFSLLRLCFVFFGKIYVRNG